MRFQTTESLSPNSSNSFGSTLNRLSRIQRFFFFFLNNPPPPKSPPLPHPDPLPIPAPAPPENGPAAPATLTPPSHPNGIGVPAQPDPTPFFSPPPEDHPPRTPEEPAAPPLEVEATSRD